MWWLGKAGWTSTRPASQIVFSIRLLILRSKGNHARIADEVCMRTKGTPAELEGRRLRAAELLGQGRVAAIVAFVPSIVARHDRGRTDVGT
jgi:hypothetical protein